MSLQSTSPFFLSAQSDQFQEYKKPKLHTQSSALQRAAGISNPNFPRSMVAASKHLTEFALAKTKFLAPREFKLETGRAVGILAENPEGLSKDELVRKFYPDYDNASALRQSSLIAGLNKILQRARARFEPFGLTIVFCKASHKWLVMPTDLI